MGSGVLNSGPHAFSTSQLLSHHLHLKSLQPLSTLSLHKMARSVLKPSCLCGSVQTVHSKLTGTIILNALNTGCACLSPYLCLWTFPFQNATSFACANPALIHTAEPSPEAFGQPKSTEICLLKHWLLGTRLSQSLFFFFFQVPFPTYILPTFPFSLQILL